MRGALASRLVFAQLAAAALAVLMGLLLLARPGAAIREQAHVARELAAVSPLHDVLAPPAFIAYLVARNSPDLHRDLEYTFVLADGSVVLGLPNSLNLRPSRDAGLLEYEAPPNSAAPGARLALRRCYANGDCLVVGERREAILRPYRDAVRNFLTAFLVGIGIALAFTVVAVRIAARDLDGADRALTSLLDGDLAQRLPVDMVSGFGVLAGKFNRLLERIEHLTLANRTVIDSTAHDLRAPLFRLRSRLEHGLLGTRSNERLIDTIEGALNEADRIEATLDALLRITLAESGTASLAAVNVGEAAADVVDLYRPIAEDKGLQFVVSLDTLAVVPANGQLLAQAIANLVDNAVKYTLAGGRIEVRVARHQGSLSVRVSDTGPGIPAADRVRAVGRSTRLANAVGTAGSGLGLALVVAVARLHGGVLQLGDNAPGLVADIVLPLPTSMA